MLDVTSREGDTPLSPLDLTSRWDVIGGGDAFKSRERVDRVTRSLCTGLSVTMPATRGFRTILRDIDSKIQRLSDDWLRVQFKKRRAKKPSRRANMKNRMDLIARVIKKLQSCRGTLVRTDEQYGNSVERQRAKEEMESRIEDLEQLVEFFSQF